MIIYLYTKFKANILFFVKDIERKTFSYIRKRRMDRRFDSSDTKCTSYIENGGGITSNFSSDTFDVVCICLHVKEQIKYCLNQTK